MQLRTPMALLGALCLTLSLGSPSQADQPSESPPTATGSGLAGFDSHTMAVNGVVEQLAELGEQFPNVVSTMSIDYETGTILQRYKTDLTDSERFADSVERLSQGSVSVLLEPVTYTRTELEETTIELYESPELAEDIFGVVPQEIGFNDQGLTVTLPKGSSQHRTMANLLNVPVTVKVATEDPAADDEEWQTSGADTSPWSGGSALNNTVGNSVNTCTSGFVWDKWTTREKLGSTAEHC